MKRLTMGAKTLVRIGVAVATCVLAVVLSKFEDGLASCIAFAAAYLVAGYDVAYKAIRRVVRGQLLDENCLMLIASVGAFILGERIESVAVILLYQVGMLMERYAVDKSRSSITAITRLRPDRAMVMRGDNEEEMSPDEVELGAIIVVRAGERIPLDGTVVQGNALIDNSFLTGESDPIEVKVGDTVNSGAVNLNSVIKIKTTTEYHESTVSRILELVENAVDKKSTAENYITKFATYYTPIVVIIAVTVAIIPSIITGEWTEWIYAALNFLVVSCPCAIVISVPLAFYAAIGATSDCGVLLKGGNYVEILAKANVFVLDKTGTITSGVLSNPEVYPKERRGEVLRLAAIAESGSNHPIAKAITGGVKSDNSGYSITEIAGKGMVAIREEEVILVGSTALLGDYGVAVPSDAGERGAVMVAKNGEFYGYVTLSDSIRATSRQAIARLKNDGAKVIILSGDDTKNVEKIAKNVGIDNYYARLLPGDKIEKLEQILAENKRGYVAFVGDGINDAPSIARADIGIAMGGIGSDAAIEVADAVLMTDDLTAISASQRICKKTLLVAKENIVLSLAIKLGIMLLSVLGFGSMWLAVVGDVGVAVAAIFNSMRVGKIGKKQ